MATLVPLPVRLVESAWVDRVPAPAHDSLTPAERRRYAADHPDSYLTVTRAPEDLPPGEVWDPVLALDSCRESLSRLIYGGAFSSTAEPAFYLYRLATAGHSQIGVVGGISVDEYDNGMVRIHEQVNNARADHLATQLDGLGVQSSPIALAHFDDDAIGKVIADRVAASDPAIEFTSPDGLRQQIWPLTDPASIEAITAAMAEAPLYLIDGHHRAAAASRHRAMAGDPGTELMLGAVFAASSLRTEAFHRCVNGIDVDRLVEQLQANSPVREVPDVHAVLARNPDEIPLRASGRWWLVTTPVAESAGPTAHDVGSGSPVDGLDPVRLQRLVLGPLLGIDASDPGDRLSYRHGLGDAADLRAIEQADHDAVWVMRPVPMETLMVVSDVGLTMPPKSTFFVPKVRSGVFLRHLR